MAEIDDMREILEDEREAYKAVGARIRQERERAGMDQATLAKHIDITDSQLREYEAGKWSANLWLLIRISNALGIDVADLVHSRVRVASTVIPEHWSPAGLHRARVLFSTSNTKVILDGRPILVCRLQLSSKLAANFPDCPLNYWSPT